MGCKPAYRKAGKESESVKSKSVDIIEPKATGLKGRRKGKRGKDRHRPQFASYVVHSFGKREKRVVLEAYQRKCEGFG